MKKYLGLLLMALVVLIPLNVKAAGLAIRDPQSNGDCKSTGDGVITCTLVYQINEGNVDEATVTLTEKGGAKIQSVTSAAGSDWTVSDHTSSNGVWTVKLNSIGVTGSGNLFTFTYVPSGSDDCGVEVATEGKVVPVTPDTPTDNKQTGTTLPYIALGGIVVLATAAYLATRNKSKMYKI